MEGEKARGMKHSRKRVGKKVEMLHYARHGEQKPGLKIGRGSLSATLGNAFRYRKQNVCTIVLRSQTYLSHVHPHSKKSIDEIIFTILPQIIWTFCLGIENRCTVLYLLGNRRKEGELYSSQEKTYSNP